ncbi:ankyrin-3-like [Carica papaya]|uniref:ankyrin-3-like n=1 Tax=Carica papaya TaxID=3649 RepID=UPI000B8CAD90|nr:ankyrin-3-like [Carica papaya]
MDKLVKPDVKEIDLVFKRGQQCTTTFRLTNLMHTMSVAVSLTTTNSSVFSFDKPFSIIPPLSSLSYDLILSPPFDQSPPAAPPNVITVKTSTLPTGKAPKEGLPLFFSKSGPHILKDATIPISLVGPHVIEDLISHSTQLPYISPFFNKAVSVCSRSELTALLRSAVVSGNANLAAGLIDHGGAANSRDRNGRSMISLAVRAGNMEIIKLLINSGCKIDSSIDHVLHDAAAINRVDVMEVLLTRFKDTISVNSVDSQGRTPLHIGATHGHSEVIQYCASLEGKIEILDNNGFSALHLAAEKGNLKAVECLLQTSSFTKYAVNREGKTAFALALENEHSDLYDALHLGDVLQRAARVDDVHGIKSYLAAGAKVNGKDQNGWTPLHRAAFKGRLECIKVLLNQGARIDEIDDAGYTPLHCAAEAGHVEVALLLVAHGAMANLKSLKGLVPLNLARFTNHPSLALHVCHEKEREVDCLNSRFKSLFS